MTSVIGERIKSLRQERGITRSDLAFKVGVTVTAVWNWEERGGRPRQPVLARVARLLGVTEEDLQMGASPLPSKLPFATTSAEIIEEARKRIAELNGFPISKVKLKLEFSSEE
jgi:transcriptional regulator with XRE-family HTH domain